MEVGGWVSRVLALRIPVVVHVEQGANECYAGMVLYSVAQEILMDLCER